MTLPVGSQGDGAVQFVAKDHHCAMALTELLKYKLGTEPYMIQIGEQSDCHSANGTSAMALSTPVSENTTVDTAIIPAAGFGTRLFPASRSIRPKALFPIVDSDGFVKPLLLYLVEQCVNAGISRVIVVVAPGEQEARVRETFSAVPRDLYKALKPHSRAYANQIAELGARVEIAIQHEPNGFGHAVTCARIKEDQPFALLLGDVAFKSATGEKSCLRQTIEAYGENPSRSVVGVCEFPVAEAGAYGVVRVAREDWERKTRVAVQEVVEKPKPEKANELSVRGKCRIVLGPYVFTPALMRQLREDVEAEKREKGEIQLTGAMASVLGMEGLDCFCLKGKALDTGNAVEYVRTMCQLGGANTQ